LLSRPAAYFLEQRVFDYAFERFEIFLDLLNCTPYCVRSFGTRHDGCGTVAPGKGSGKFTHVCDA
jgi:hypothetical protein